MSWYSRWIVVSDLDGTLLEHHDYSWRAAKVAVQRLADHGVPLILCSSKTFAEMRSLAAEMRLDHPLIVENGAAIAWPSGDGYRLETMGRPRREVVAEAHRLRMERGYKFSGFADWPVAEVVQRSGLGEAAASASLERHGTEPIVWDDSDAAYDEFVQSLASLQIRAVRGGRFIHLMGDFDKADGVDAVRDHFSRKWGTEVAVLALGDSPNDAAMLNAADVAVCIRSAQSTTMELHAPRVINTEAPGPAGWAAALDEWWQARGEIQPTNQPIDKQTNR